MQLDIDFALYLKNFDDSTAYYLTDFESIANCFECLDFWSYGFKGFANYCGCQITAS